MKASRNRATGRDVASSCASKGTWRAKTVLAYSPDGRRLAGTGEELETD